MISAWLLVWPNGDTPKSAIYKQHGTKFVIIQVILYVFVFSKLAELHKKILLFICEVLSLETRNSPYYLLHSLWHFYLEPKIWTKYRQLFLAYLYLIWSSYPITTTACCVLRTQSITYHVLYELRQSRIAARVLTAHVYKAAMIRYILVSANLSYMILKMIGTRRKIK